MVDKGGLDYRIDVNGSFESVLQSFRTETDLARKSWTDFKKAFTASASETNKTRKAIASVTQESEKQRKSNSKTIEQRLRNISATKAEAVAIRQLTREAFAQEVSLQKALISRRIEFQIQRRRFQQVQQQVLAEQKLTQVLNQRGAGAAIEAQAFKQRISLTDQEKRQLKLLTSAQLELLRVKEQLKKQGDRLSPDVTKLRQELETQKQLTAVIDERTRADRISQGAKAKGIQLTDQELLGLRALTGAEKALAEARVRLDRSKVSADQRVVALNAQRQATEALARVETARARQAFLVQAAQKSGIKLTDEEKNKLGLLTEQEKALFNARKLREKAQAANQTEVQQIRNELAAQKEVAEILRERTRRELLLQAAKRQGTSITNQELNQRGLLKGAEKDLFEQEQKNKHLRDTSSNTRLQQLKAEEIAIKRIQQADIQRAAAANLKALGRTESGQLVTFRSRLEGLVKTMNASRFVSGQNVISFRRLLTVIGAFATFRTAIRLFKGFVSTIIDFNSVVETSTLGIGSLLTAVGEIRNVTGEAVSATEALTLAQGIARDQLRLLRIDALKTAATFEELVETFQVAVAPGLQAGLDVDQIRRFTIAVSQAAQAINLPQNQLAEEIRSILEGTIQQRTTRIAVALGITNEDIRRAKELGVLAQFLENRFAAFGEAGKLALTTFTAIIANTRGALRLVIGSGGAEFFESLKTEIENFRQQLVTLNDITGELEPNPRFVSAVKIIADSLKRAVINARVFAAELGFEDAEESARNLAAIFDGISRVVISFARGLLKGVEDIRRAFTATFETVQKIAKKLGLEEAFDVDTADDFLATLARIAVVLTAIKAVISISLINQFTVAVQGLWAALIALKNNPVGLALIALALIVGTITVAYIKSRIEVTRYSDALLNLASDLGIFLSDAQKQAFIQDKVTRAVDNTTKATDALNSALARKAPLQEQLALNEQLIVALDGQKKAIRERDKESVKGINDDLARRKKFLAELNQGIEENANREVNTGSFLNPGGFKKQLADKVALVKETSDEIRRLLEPSDNVVLDKDREAFERLSKELMLRKGDLANIERIIAERTVQDNEVRASDAKIIIAARDRQAAEIKNLEAQRELKTKDISGIDAKVEAAIARSIVLTDALAKGAANPFEAAETALKNFADQLQGLPGILLGVRGSLSDQAKSVNELEKAYIDANEARLQSERGLGVSGTGKSLIAEQARAETELRERTNELQKEQLETESKILAAREQIRLATLKQVGLDEKVGSAVDKRVARLQKAASLQTAIQKQENQASLARLGLTEAKKNRDTEKVSALTEESTRLNEEITASKKELDDLTASAADDFVGVPADQRATVETVSGQKAGALGTEVALNERLVQIGEDRQGLAERINKVSIERQRLILQEALAEQKNQAAITIAQSKAAVALAEAQKAGASEATLARIEQQGLLDILTLQTKQTEKAREDDIKALEANLVEKQLRVESLELAAEELEAGKEKDLVEESLLATMEAIKLLRDEIVLKQEEGLAFAQQETIELEKQQAILDLETVREEEPVTTGIVEGAKGALDDSLKELTDYKTQATSIIKGFGATVGGILSDALDPNKDVDIGQRFADFFRGIATQILTLITTIATAAIVLEFIPGAKAILQLLAAAQGVSVARGGKIPNKGNASPAHAGAPGYDTGGKIDPKSVRPKNVHHSDTVPIWAAPGEFMVRTKAVAKYGMGVMERINKGLIDASELRAVAGISGTINRRPRGSSRQVGFAEGGPVVSRQSVSTITGTAGQQGSGFQQAVIVADEQSMERLIGGGESALRAFMQKNKAVLR